MIGELPDTVSVAVWDGRTDPPPGIEDVRFYVPPFGAGPRIGEAMAAMTGLEVVQAQDRRLRPHRAACPAGVTLCNARGAHSPATSECVLAAILTVLRQFPRYAAEQLAGISEQRRADTLDGKRVTILGYGSIGEAVERRMSGFDVTVARVARSARDGVHALADLDALLPQTDVLVVVVPLDDSTRGLVSPSASRCYRTARWSSTRRGAGSSTSRHCSTSSTADRLPPRSSVAVPDPAPSTSRSATHRASSTRRTSPLHGRGSVTNL